MSEENRPAPAKLSANVVAIVIAILAAMPPTIVALAALRQGKTNEQKSDTLIEKTAEIHTLTNSNLSKVTASLAVANEKIEGLEKLISAMAPKAPKK